VLAATFVAVTAAAAACPQCQPLSSVYVVGRVLVLVWSRSPCPSHIFVRLSMQSCRPVWRSCRQAPCAVCQAHGQGKLTGG